MIKVGYQRADDLTKKYTYKDCVHDKDMWVDGKKFMPLDYDLCTLKLKGDIYKRGWASGLSWDGLYFQEGDDVVAWRKD